MLPPGEEGQLRVPTGGHEKSTVHGGEGQRWHRGRDVLIKGTQQPLSAIVPKLDQTVPAGGYRLGFHNGTWACYTMWSL